jgi:predicted membrane metal-binding protein
VEDERGVSLLLSMALGYRDVLSPSVEQAFSSLGLTHLLVVSGYQVSMVFGFVMAIAVMLVPRASVFRYWREGCTAIGLMVASVYVVLIGAEMSAARALIAAAFVCAERVCESRSGFAQRWSVALSGFFSKLEYACWVIPNLSAICFCENPLASRSKRIVSISVEPIFIIPPIYKLKLCYVVKS